MLTWDLALADCEAWGGSLVAITSSEENTLVLGFAGDDTWLGGTDAAVEGTWTWVSGELWGYESWEAGEPNDSGNCLQVWHAAAEGWDDTTCDTEKAYVCERAGS